MTDEQAERLRVVAELLDDEGYPDRWVVRSLADSYEHGITEEEALLDLARVELDARPSSTLAEHLRPLRASLADKLRSAFREADKDG